MHIIFIGILVFGATLAVLYAIARYKHLTFKQESSALIHQLTMYGSKLDSDLLAKVHALENGGHLAAGTTQQLINSQTVTTVPNGGQPPAAPATT